MIELINQLEEITDKKKIMEIKEIISLINVKFEKRIDTSVWGFNLIYQHLYNAEMSNNYVMITALQDADYFDITFFKSEYLNEKILDDYLSLGVTFKPKTIKDVECILNSVDA